MVRIGVLALQGDFEAHRRGFAELGVAVVEVRRTRDLGELDGLVMPGGESTTLLHLMADEPWFEELRALHARGGALFGTCAGAILLAREVIGPAQPSLGLLDVSIRRNAYGRQVDSFEARVRLDGARRPLPAVFIRAPRFVHIGPGVAVLARLGDEPVLVREGRVLAATFHPELTRDRRLQRTFLRVLAGGPGARGRASKAQAEENEQIHPGPLAEERRIPC